MGDEEVIRAQAQVLWERAYRHQMKGELADAIVLYKRSIAVLATAEAYTFLAWTYSMIDLYDEAIDLCKQAIALDPDFGNPYNDIGAYLIELERWQEAIPWLEQAINAPRYATPEFALLNLGRVYDHLGDIRQALACYRRAQAVAPLYLPAIWAHYALLGKLN
jgi:Tfp pilus assembly protein PilF